MLRQPTRRSSRESGLASLIRPIGSTPTAGLPRSRRGGPGRDRGRETTSGPPARTVRHPACRQSRRPPSPRAERPSSIPSRRSDAGTARTRPSRRRVSLPHRRRPPPPRRAPPPGRTGSAPARRRPDVGDLVVRAGTAFEDYRQGKPGAIDTLVRLVSPLLWHTARQCGLTAAEAEDAVQQTFLQLVRSKDSISDPLAVVRWLTVSLRRLAWREKAEQLEALQRGADRRRPAARAVRGARRGAERPAAPAVGAGLPNCPSAAADCSR